MFFQASLIRYLTREALASRFFDLPKELSFIVIGREEELLEDMYKNSPATTLD
jgi:hypothetical protein